MRYARRKLLKLGLGALPLTYFLANRTSLLTATATAATPTATKPNSKFNGVQIGIIAPYSFRGLPSTAEVLLHNLVELGISAVELQNDPVERFAGAPAGGGRGDGPGRPGAIPGLNAEQQAALTAINESLAPKNQAVSTARTALAQAAYSDAAAIQSRLGTLTAAELELANSRAEAIAKLQSSPQRLNADQINALIAQAVPPPPGGGRGGPGGGANPEMTKWRASVSMDKFKALRKRYNDAGVSIYGFKLDLRLNGSDSEYEYAFNVCETLGANQLTMELPSDPATSKRIGEYAA